MGEFLIQIILVSFWCWGFMNAFNDGNIFGGIGKIIRKTVTGWVYKPTIGCVKCLASTHGTIFYLAWYGPHNFFMWLLFIVAISGLNTIIINLSPDE